MSDFPSKPNKDESVELKGGWQKPSASGGWRIPEKEQESTTGWRVPTLPTTLDSEPENEGSWHLPKLEDTSFTPEDVSQVIGVVERPPDAIDPIDALADAVTGFADEQQTSSKPTKADQQDALSPEDMMLTVEGESPTVEEEPPAPKAAAQTPEDLLSMALDVDQSALEELEDDEAEGFSMSELIALASLVGDEPKADVMQGESGPTIASVIPLAGDVEETQIDYSALSNAERALLQATEAMPQAPDLDDSAAADAAEYARQQLAKLSEDENAPAPKATAIADGAALDPAEYARQQLAQLGGTEEQPAAGAGTAAVDDPAEYARQQLAQLGADEGHPGDFTPLPQQTEPIDPALAELATKFQQTEQQVRGLRDMYRAGQITRDDLQTRLRQHMILDNNQVWWMMGVETDTWYKFENNEWIAATPPALGAGKKYAGPPPTITSELDPNQVIQGSLPYLPSERIQEASQGHTDYGTPHDSSQIQLDENNMPLPRQVDEYDPNFTVVNPNAAFGGQVRSHEAPTLQNNLTVPTPVQSAPTMLAQPVQYGAADDYEAVQAPYNAEAEPPDYGIGSVEDTPFYEQVAQKRQQQTLRTVILVAIVLAGIMFIAATIFVVGALAWYNGIVEEWEPQIVALQNFEPAFQTARILDARGDLIAELNSQDGGARIKVSLENIAPELIFSVIAVENERFYDDPGWDIVAISRAFFQNLTSGEISSGGSTITQQIARNLVLQNTEVTAERKIQEIVIAGEIAKRYDKNFILQLYLNEVFFGNQSYGVEAASEFYFGKKATDVTLAEAAMLAGLIQSPAVYDPVVNRTDAFARMRVVLDRVAQVGCLQFQHDPYTTEPFCIPSTQIYQANQEFTPELTVQVSFVEGRPYLPRKFSVEYPHFVSFIQAQIENFFGPGEMFRRGFVIRTTLVPQIQDTAENALRTRLAQLVNTGVNTGAVMVTDPNTGAIRAMVGSPDFNNADIDGQVNNVLTPQQPGSSIKPITYTAAFEGVDRNGNGRLDTDEYLTPASILWDVPTTYQQFNYSPVNFDRTFRGPVAARYALANSYNVPAVKVYDFIGNDKFKNVAERMGLRFSADTEFTLATGVGATDVRLYDMMSAYGTLASGGRFVTLFAIESVTDSEGRVVEIPGRQGPQQVIQPELAYLVTNILSDDNARASAFGRNSALTLPGWPARDAVAAKTGTSNDNRDLWTMGYTKTAVVGVWMGRHDNRETVAQGGFVAAAPVWNQTMQAAVLGVQPQTFTPTANIIALQICADTGTVTFEGCPVTSSEIFVASQPPPPANQSFVQSVEVDTWTGLRANEFCPDNRETRVVADIRDSAAITWLNGTGGGQAFAQRLGLPLPLQSPPSGSCELGTTIPTARIIDPFENKTLEGVVSVTGQVSANPSEFSRYQLEYADVNAPQTFRIIGDVSTQQQPNAGAVLGSWDTRAVPNGTYILRLAVFSNSGGFLYRTVRVNVNNAAPTAVPTIPPTFAPPAEITPIPFDTVPAQSAPGAPTATVEVPSL